MIESAGLLLYRRRPRRFLEVFLIHMGGPIWANRAMKPTLVVARSRSEPECFNFAPGGVDNSALAPKFRVKSAKQCIPIVASVVNSRSKVARALLAILVQSKPLTCHALFNQFSEIGRHKRYPPGSRRCRRPADVYCSLVRWRRSA